LYSHFVNIRHIHRRFSAMALDRHME
jgi:hypothetical protein